MKRLLLLLLVFTGMVSTASATDYVIVGDNAGAVNGSDTWANNSDVNTMIETSEGSGVYYLKVETSLTAGTEVKAAPLIKNNWTRAFYDEGQSRTGDWTYGINVGETGDYTLYYYLDPTNHVFDIFAKPMLRSNIGNSGNGNFTWKYETSSDFTQDDYFNWHYDMPYASLADENSFFIYTKVNYRSVYTYSSPKTELTLPATISSAVYFNGDRYDWNTKTESYSEEHRWFFEKPDYSCDFVRVALTYDVATQGMSIKVTPYISKTLPVSEGGTYYGTFGSKANVDFTNVTGLTAQKITAASLATGVLTPTTATTLYAGEGALLSASSAGPFSIPVAASADADANNLLVAGNGASVDETADGYTNFILTNRKVDGNGDDVDADLKFYRINSSKVIPAGSAYLHVLTSSLARESFWFEDGTTGINTVKGSEFMVNGSDFFDLQGRKVAQPSKGLYIVNGKKVVLK